MPGDCLIHACAAIYPDGEADMRDRRGASPSAHPWCTKKVSNLPWRLELDLQSSPKSQPLKIFSESRLQSVSKSAKHISTSYDHWLIKSLDSSMVLPFVFFRKLQCWESRHVCYSDSSDQKHLRVCRICRRYSRKQLLLFLVAMVAWVKEFTWGLVQEPCQPLILKDCTNKYQNTYTQV